MDEVNAWLANLPDHQRAALEELRRMISEAAPATQEGISYSLPAFRYRGRPLVSYGASKNHCAFYCMSPAVMDAHAEELRGYDTSKGTIRFLHTESPWGPPGAPSRRPTRRP